MSHIAGSTTFIVKTFMRPGCLGRLVASCRRFYPGVRILVADDSREPVRRDDVEVIVLPFDSGLSHGRNRLLDRVETKYFVLMDDDHVLTGETKLETLLDALDSGEFDLVGGVQVEEDGGRFAWEGLFRRDGDTLVLAPGDQGEVDGVKRVDFCLNFFAARTDAVREVRWDDHFKMGEHTDFFLRCQGRIRVGFCPGVRIRHEPERPSDYLPFRERAEQTYRRDFLEKHGLRELVNELHPGRDQPDTSPSRSRSALETLRAFFRRS